MTQCQPGAWWSSGEHDETAWERTGHLPSYSGTSNHMVSLRDCSSSAPSSLVSVDSMWGIVSITIVSAT